MHVRTLSSPKSTVTNPIPRDEKFNTTSLLVSNEVQVFERDFNDAILQYITSSSVLQNETEANWYGSTINSPVKNYFYIDDNGLKVLRVRIPPAQKYRIFFLRVLTTRT